MYLKIDKPNLPHNVEAKLEAHVNIVKAFQKHISDLLPCSTLICILSNYLILYFATRVSNMATF